MQVSIIEADGTLDQKVQVRRLIAHGKQQQIMSAQKKLSYELKLLISGQLKPQEVTSSTISYHLQTEDEYLKNNWFMNQTFGFHGVISKTDQKFLEKFYGEECRKFLPVAGVATKLNSSNMLIAHAYSFLPLPIQTGLPVHVNGHFAIHSSRRSIWEHTSFGLWNKVLRDHIMAPAYCHFLIDLGKTFHTTTDIKRWIRFLPETSRAKDDFFCLLVRRVYSYMLEAALPIIPIPKENLLSFHPPGGCLFATAVRNSVVESVLLNLGQNVCTASEVGLRFKMASVTGLHYIKPDIVLECLKRSNLELHKCIKDTPFTDEETLRQVIVYVLEGSAAKDYRLLANAPLCLTSDNNLRLFSPQSPVFVDSEFSELNPNFGKMFIHEHISSNFVSMRSQQGNDSIRCLQFEDVGALVQESSAFTNISWSKLLWKFIKVSAVEFKN